MPQAPAPLNSDEAIRALAQAFIARELPKAAWTHQAHFAAALCLHREHDDITLSADLPALIRAYNVSVGGRNTDEEGYHETLTQFYARLIAHICERLPHASMAEQLAAIMGSQFGARAFPLRFWSKAALFSVDARRRWVEPDLAPLDLDAVTLDGVQPDDA